MIAAKANKAVRLISLAPHQKFDHSRRVWPAVHVISHEHVSRCRFIRDCSNSVEERNELLEAAMNVAYGDGRCSRQSHHRNAHDVRFLCNFERISRNVKLGGRMRHSPKNMDFAPSLETVEKFYVAEFVLPLLSYFTRAQCANQQTMNTGKVRSASCATDSRSSRDRDSATYQCAPFIGCARS